MLAAATVLGLRAAGFRRWHIRSYGAAGVGVCDSMMMLLTAVVACLALCPLPSLAAGTTAATPPARSRDGDGSDSGPNADGPAAHGNSSDGRADAAAVTNSGALLAELVAMRDEMRQEWRQIRRELRQTVQVTSCQPLTVHLCQLKLWTLDPR